MLKLPMVMLLHQTPSGSHFDWLLADPGEPGGRLWSARCGFKAEDWPKAGCLLLERLPAHRRRYLTYEGPLAPVVDQQGRMQPRGWVRQVDKGWFEPTLWCEDRGLVRLHWSKVSGLAQLERLSSKHWRLIWRETGGI